MVTLFETIQCWADGQNGLNARDPADRQTIQPAVEGLVASLRRHASLAELAAGYYANDVSIRLIGEEFAVSPDETSLLRDAAHWQRFMEIRHPEMVQHR